MELSLLLLCIAVLVIVYTIQPEMIEFQTPLFRFLAEWEMPPTMVLCLNLISRMATEFCYCSLFLIFYMIGAFKATKHAMFQITLCLGIIAILKMIFGSPRPFHYWDFFPARQCSKGYGFPSGHMLSSIGVMTWLFDYLLENANESQKKWIKISKSLYWIIYVPLLAFSRMYLGSHTLDQVVFGGLLGMLIAIITKEARPENFKSIIIKIFITNVLLCSVHSLYGGWIQFKDFSPIAMSKCPHSKIGDLIRNAVWIDTGKMMIGVVYFLSVMPHYKTWKDDCTMVRLFLRNALWIVFSMMAFVSYNMVNAFWLKITLVYGCLCISMYGLFQRSVLLYAVKTEDTKNQIA